jgi:hypothetical protein
MERVQHSERPRYERKYLVEGLSRGQIESAVRLHPALFSEVHQERFVNSLYFDSFDMDDYFESMSGAPDRRKIRIRWYGDAFGSIDDPVLELKAKKGLIGLKDRFSLVPFSFDTDTRLDTIRDVFRRSAIPARLELHLMFLEPSLLTRYRRKYYQSADGRFRITIDSDLECYQFSGGNNTLLRSVMRGMETILELKYDPEADEDARRISTCFPFRLTKSSKYVSGVKRLSLY